MASDCVGAAESLREIERALHEPTDSLFVEKAEIDDIDSDLDEDELDKLQMEGKSANTLKQTSWGIKAFTEWAFRGNIDVEFETITAKDLAIILRKFFAEYRTKKAELPTPSTLRSLRAAIHRTLKDPPYSRNINIMVDKEFVGAHSMFEARCKAYFAQGGKSLQHKPCIEQGDMLKLSSYFGDLENTDPSILQEMVWFELCFFLGRRGREGWRGFTKTTLQLKRDDNNKHYLTFASAEQTKNWQGTNPSNQDYSDVRIYENKSPKDPVSMYLFYLSKLHPDCDAMFQSPRRDFEKSGVWYNNCPLGKNTLGTLMQKISKKAGLSQTYTCHSVRASTITYLYQAGVDTKQICNITKHKSEESLKHYISGSSSAQKRASSEILQGVLAPKMPANCLDQHQSSAGAERRIAVQKQVDMTYGSFDISAGFPDVMAPNPYPRFAGNVSFLAGANINNCTINYIVGPNKNVEN